MTKRNRTIGAIAITAAGSLAIFAGPASATQGHIAADCAAASFSYDTFGLGTQPGPPYAIVLDGQPLATGRFADFTGPATSYQVPLNLTGEHDLEATTTPYPGRPPVNLVAHLSCPVPAADLVASSDVTPAGLAPLVKVPRVRRPTRAQKPRLSCRQLVHHRAGVRSLVGRGCDIPPRLRRHPRVVAVAGEYRRAQGPAPGTIVSRLLNQVPQLAEDLPGPASSISQSAGGKSATGTMDATERGRLVPKVIPGHPWTTKSTSPHRGVVASVSWKSGRLTVSVLYSASRGRSTTSVSAT